jgi:hypothetical protein
MKHFLKPIFTLAAFALIAANSVYAETEIIIALKTDNFELTETDISALAIGEAKTIETESGSIIDILRTTDGAEIYVDGELLEMDFDHEGIHGEHMIKKHVEVICESDEDCGEHVIVLSGDEDVSDWVTEKGDNIFIHKEIELSCTDDEEGTSCSDKMIWVSEGEDIDLEEIHEMHKGEDSHKVIVIKKQINTQD